MEPEGAQEAAPWRSKDWREMVDEEGEVKWGGSASTSFLGECKPKYISRRPPCSKPASVRRAQKGALKQSPDPEPYTRWESQNPP